jgi:DNA-binding response OmpR family regulator
LKALQTHDYPTVLVAGDGDELDSLLVNCLRRNGFHALEADWEVVFDVVRVHSKRIDLLVADVSLEAHVPILKRHRSELQVLLIKKPFDVGDLLAKIRQLLDSPPSPSSIR